MNLKTKFILSATHLGNSIEGDKHKTFISIDLSFKHYFNYLKDEIVSLATSFNTMAESVESVRGNLVKTNTAYS